MGNTLCNTQQDTLDFNGNLRPGTKHFRNRESISSSLGKTQGSTLSQFSFLNKLA